MSSTLRTSWPSTKREKCSSIMKQAGGPPMDTPTPTTPLCSSTSTTTVPSASMPHVLRLVLASWNTEEGLAMGVSTIQWPCFWLWQSAPPPAASSAALVPMVKARTSLMVKPLRGRAGGARAG